MFKVECPNCSAPYQVDERRVPASGLKMRCPKCGHAFVVDPPGQSAPAQPAVPAGRSGVASPANVPPRKVAHAPTIGMPSGAARAADLPAVASGLPAALGGLQRGTADARRRPPQRDPEPISGDFAEDGAEAELDLPTLGERLHGARRAAAQGGDGGRQVTAETDEQTADEPDLPSVREFGGGRRFVGVTPHASFDAETRPGRRGPIGRARKYDGEMDLGLPLVVPSASGAARGPGAAEKPGPAATERSAESPSPSPDADVQDPLGIDLDLPALSGDLDLPSPRASADDANAPTFQDVSFAGDLPSPAFDLPSPASDLPSPASDLPSPAFDLPSPASDLPSPASDLPSPGPDLGATRPGLPARRGTAGTGQPAWPPGRSAAGGGVPLHAAAPASAAAESAARPPPPPRVAQKLPPRPGRPPPPPVRPQSVGTPEAPAPVVALDERAAGDEFDPFAAGAPETVPTLPEAEDSLGARHEIPDEFASMDVDVESMQGPELSGSATPSSPPEDAIARASSSLVREAGGGTSFGEVNLEGALDGALPEASMPPVPQAADDDMEFGAIPQETEAAAPPPSEAPASAGAAPEQTVQQRLRRRRRRLATVGALVGTLALGGAALALVPSLGPYGVYFLTDQLRRGEYQKVLADEVRSARRALGRDTRASAQEAMSHVERTLRSYRRVRGLAAYGAFIGELIELRYREESAMKARADVMLDEQAGATDTPYLNLAGATRAAAEGRLALARQRLARVTRADGDLDALIVRGELELNAGEPKEAVVCFGRAEQRDKSARTSFGLARAQLASGNAAEAHAQAQLTLERNPDHIGARIVLARLSWASERDDTAALSLLEQALKLRERASALELVDAYTLIGDIHLERSRVSLAEAAFGEALKVRPQAARALAGLGDALYRAGRYSEALARFAAAIQVDPDELTAAVGAAKTKIALEKPHDASTMLSRLREVHPRATLVHYWYGRAEEAQGKRDEAEKAYRAAIAGDGKGTDLVQAYVALATLMNQEGRSEEAQKTLATAKERLSDLPEIYRALGELALAQGRYEEALSDFGVALQRNPEDLSSRFYLGVALRHSRKLEEAVEAFDLVAKVDRDYPGLALERGLLYEASGRTEEALKAYEAALAKAPEDPDLMLRVGCGRVVAGHPEQAAELLRKVLIQRPNSAETNHCLGRALLAEGSNLALALRTLKRAVDLDPNRAEYYLYVGWAANEAGRVVEAEAALKQALALDQGLADAYWQRGVLRYRQGAVKDAVQDLTRALELKPARYEAHAALADCYYDLGREGEALEQWRQAIEARPENATWRYRYGRLLQQNQRSAEARVELEKALELAEETDQQPRWMWEAHRLLARAMGRQPAAAKHWQAFLRLSPADNAYREEAKSELAKLGQPWDGP
jgi:predicted Zn finger-like uncharacterized protein